MSRQSKSGRFQTWRLRLLALLLGCLPLMVCEWALRGVGWPAGSSSVDPLVDLHHLQPLFTSSSDGQELFIAPERLDLFREARFSKRKAPGTLRIFALGGSTTQGEPYSTPTAFPAWMGIDLETATGKKFEVINCGGLSYASYRVKAILEEVLDYSPDLIVLYTGQNEFLERRSYEGWRNVPLPVARASHWLGGWKVVQAVRWLVRGDAKRSAPGTMRPTELAREVDALLDYQGGLAEYHRDDEWRTPVVAHFRWNLSQMVELCQSRGVRLILMRPAVNLLDCPPMKFEIRSDLSEDQRARFQAAWTSAQLHHDDPQLAKEQLKIAASIDPEHAGVNYFLGRLAWEVGSWDEAKQFLTAAKDNDVCPLRAISEIQAAVSQVAADYHIPMMDADKLLSDLSPHGIVGNKWMVDHVHPTIEGHQLLGEALCQLCLDQRWYPELDPDWRSNRMERVRSHLQSLGEDYYQRGKQRLEGLLLWTQGRAKKIRP